MFCFKPVVSQINMETTIAYQDLVMTVINCTFLDGGSHYCLICCSDKANMATFLTGNMSASKGMDVMVHLGGLEDRETYFCAATGTDGGDSICESGNTGESDVVTVG